MLACFSIQHHDFCNPDGCFLVTPFFPNDLHYWTVIEVHFKQTIKDDTVMILLYGAFLFNKHKCVQQSEDGLVQRTVSSEEMSVYPFLLSLSSILEVSQQSLEKKNMGFAEVLQKLSKLLRAWKGRCFHRQLFSYSSHMIKCNAQYCHCLNYFNQQQLHLTEVQEFGISSVIAIKTSKVK